MFLVSKINIQFKLSYKLYLFILNDKSLKYIDNNIVELLLDTLHLPQERYVQRACVYRLRPHPIRATRQNRERAVGRSPFMLRFKPAV